MQLYASIGQWIDRKFPKLQIWVRFPVEAPKSCLKLCPGSSVGQKQQPSYGIIYRNRLQGVKSGEVYLIRVRLSSPCLSCRSCVRIAVGVQIFINILQRLIRCRPQQSLQSNIRNLWKYYNRKGVDASVSYFTSFLLYGK